LVPQQRTDRGVSKLPATVQEALLAAKRENPRRSIRQLKILLENAGTVPRGTLSRSAIHRFLQQQGVSRSKGSASMPEEHRRFDALANCHRRRRKPDAVKTSSTSITNTTSAAAGPNLVELAFAQHYATRPEEKA
jgi:hypothetical protein